MCRISKINMDKTIIIPILCGIIFLVCGSVCAKEKEYNFISANKNVLVCDGKNCSEAFTRAETVGEFLEKNNITTKDSDLIFPDKDQKIYSGSKISIMRAKNIIAKEGGKSFNFVTFQDNVEEAIWENGEILLAEDDITDPGRKKLIQDNMKIIVTHVIIKEEIEEEKINFSTKSNENEKMSWREKKVTQKGEKGIQEIRYKVVYHDGKEISRKVLEKKVTKEPIEEIVTQGTYVKVGKSHSGLGTWYSFRGGLFAASPWLPIGSYARVTNNENGESVIVQINDRGPFGKNRIIDLDKVAFQKIASLGAGIIDVKVEEVLN
jgi:rare lipoprotein A (peptidoglycan hydrolase)